MNSLNPIGKVRRRRGSTQKQAIKEFLRSAGWNCWHCGQHIGYRKVNNAAHKYPKGRYPELACDPGNFYLLCCNVDVQDRRGCHEIFDGGSIEEWNDLQDSVQPMNKNLKHRSELEYQPVT